MVKILYPDGKCTTIKSADTYSMESSRYILFDKKMRKVGSLDRMPGMCVYIDYGEDEN